MLPFWEVGLGVGRDEVGAALLRCCMMVFLCLKVRSSLMKTFGEAICLRLLEVQRSSHFKMGSRIFAYARFGLIGATLGRVMVLPGSRKDVIPLNLLRKVLISVHMFLMTMDCQVFSHSLRSTASSYINF